VPRGRLALPARLLGGLCAVLVALGLLIAPTPAAAAPGDVGVEGPSHTGTGTPTGTKRAESVLWHNDGFWWGVLWNSTAADFHIYQFKSNAWVDTGVKVDTRNDVHNDVLWDGTTLFVATHKFVADGVAAVSGYPSTLYRYSYDRATDRYTALGSTQINNMRTETLTIDKDSTGRIWATWQQGNAIYLNVTGTDGRTWGTPFRHPHAEAGVSIDDTSALIAFGGNRMGLMWSRQLGDGTDGFWWSVHDDGAGSTTWSTPKQIRSGLGSGDDHMNLKWLDSSGARVFAAVKTSFTGSTEPLIELLSMSTSGVWSAREIARVNECPNRAIVLIDDAAQRIRTFATYPKPSGTDVTNAGVCTTSGGAIFEKSYPLDNVSYTTEKTVRIMDADQYVHNVSSTKQNINGSTGLLVIADVNATSRYWHHYEAPTDTTAPTVTAVSPDGTTPPVGTNVSGTFSEAMNASTVTGSTFTLAQGTTPVGASVTYDATSRVATLDPSSDLTAGTTYTATIKGGSSGVKDLAGNPLATDQKWTFTTAAAGGGTGTSVTLTATADSYVSSGTATSNFGSSTVLNVDASPANISYLKFDLTPYAGRTITGATLQLRCTTSGSTGTQNVKLVADDAWTELGVTYGSRPALGTLVGRLGPAAASTSYEVSLDSSALQAELGGQLSLGLDSSSSDGVDLGSRESTTPPKLVLTLAP